jgi:hypothetical protein
MREQLYVTRPLVWTDKNTDPRRPGYIFRASFTQTRELLFAELVHLEARFPVALQIDIAEGDIRLDGLPRANARFATHPGVAISFESRFGSLRYATDAYDDWQANVRAIALSLQALRSVDRWGVSRRGEQYTGWKALPAGTGGLVSPNFDDVFAAADWMRKYAALTLNLTISEGRNPDGKSSGWRDLYRAMARRMHPDQPGATRDDWDRLDEARRLIESEGWM